MATIKYNLIDELKWRGMIQDIMPGTEDLLEKEIVSGYIGFDPTSDSLHVGSLVPIMMLLHFQQAGHNPIALVGGATGMIGDPSGKKEERKLLSIEDINYNESCIKKQLEKFLDFNSTTNPAILVNNNDWFGSLPTISFLREAGKYITVNYLLSKGFVKDRMSQNQELSFTEFNYILMQAYDFMWLYQNKNCKLQMGGSDQWGNITTGTELIRKKLRGDTYGLTCPLMVKADGGKFGKTEEGNVWLDPKKTSPYQFYQFWLNASDADVKKHIRIFTLFKEEEIKTIEEQHATEPHVRHLQRALAKDITIRVHSEKDYENSLAASEILFGKGTTEMLRQLDEQALLDIFSGVPQFNISKSKIENGISSIELLSTSAPICASKGEAKRLLQSNGVSINKAKINDSYLTSANDLLNGKYLLVQKGKKDYYLLIAG